MVRPAEATNNIGVWLLSPLMKIWIYSMLLMLWFRPLNNNSLNLSYESYKDSVSYCSKFVILTLLSENWVMVKNLSRKLSYNSFQVRIVSLERHTNQYLSFPINEKMNNLNFTRFLVTPVGLHIEVVS